MLYQSFQTGHAVAPGLPPYPIETALFAELLNDTREALDHDVETAHRCLDRLAALLERPEASEPSEYHLLASTRLGDASASPVKGGLAPWQLRRVMSFIDDNLAGPVFVDALASVARLSSGHFCRAFKTSVGETPHNFLVRQRVRRAQALMLDTTDTLSQIACACGLTDQAHLTRLFRKFVGATPLSWRRTWQNA